MKAGLAAALVLVVAGAWAIPALGGTDTTGQASAQTLERRVKTLERQVRALKLLYLRVPNPRVSSRTGSLTPVGNNSYSGSVSCLGAEPLGGGVEFLGQVYIDDQVFDSYPTSTGWYISTRTRSATPVAHVTCLSLK